MQCGLSSARELAMKHLQCVFYMYLCNCDVLALFTVTIIVHALYMKQLHCDAPFRTVVWHNWTVSTDPTIDTQLCSCTIDNMKGFVQCTIQNIFIPFSNGYTRVAIHSCMEVPFLHYMLVGHHESFVAAPSGDQARSINRCSFLSGDTKWISRSI